MGIRVESRARRRERERRERRERRVGGKVDKGLTGVKDLCCVPFERAF
jgi:hypothetical protein